MVVVSENMPTVIWGLEKPKVGKFLAKVQNLGKNSQNFGEILRSRKLKVRNWHDTYKIYE